MNIIKFENLKLKNICDSIKAGSTAVLPFDTVYGLVASPFDDTAMEKIYKIKGRDFDKPIALIFSSVKMLKKYISLSAEQEVYITDKVPGAYTIILPWVAGGRDRFSSHYQKLEKIGIRIPNYKFILELAEELGHPIAATSANVSGKENCWNVADFINQIKYQKNKPDLIVDVGELPKNPPSQIIDLSNLEKIKILRR